MNKVCNDVIDMFILCVLILRIRKDNLRKKNSADWIHVIFNFLFNLALSKQNQNDLVHVTNVPLGH